MKWLENISTQSKLFIIFGLMVLIAALGAARNVTSAANVRRQMYALQEITLTAQRNAEAQANMLREQLASKNALLTPEDDQYWGDSMRYWWQFYNYAVYAQMIAGSDEESSTLENMQTDWDLYGNLSDTAYYMAEDSASNLPEAIQISQEQADPLTQEIDDQLKILADDYARQVREQHAAIESYLQFSAFFGIISLAVLALLVILGVSITGQISAPLQGLTSAVVAFQNNMYRPEMLAAYAHRRDELGQLARAIDAMASSITEANRTKDQFLQSAARFVPSQYLEFLEKDSLAQLKLGDHVSAEMAVMFSDIRGFTTLSEKMTAQQNFDFVNEYLKLVSPVIQSNEGFIVKFLGDGMMAIFPYGVDDAVQAGIQKQEKVNAFNAVLRERGYPSISVGIGIHTGHMMVGMIGEEKRMQGDAFSDNVNLTSRVEGLNKFYGTSMIITEETLRSLKTPSSYKMRYLGKVQVKGRDAPLSLYEIYEGLPAEEAAIKEATRADFERGVALYTEGRFAEAQHAFDAVLDKSPDDKTARLYLERCFEWVERGAPDDWTGVIVMDAK